VHAEKSKHAEVPINAVTGELPRPCVAHFVPTHEEVFNAIIDVLVDGSIGLQTRATRALLSVLRIDGCCDVLICRCADRLQKEDAAIPLPDASFRSPM
jgi:hypothetical protein